MDNEHLTFLLTLLIEKVVSDIREPDDFVLYYRLDEGATMKIMDEVGKIADKIKAGKAVTSSDVLERVGTFYKPGMGTEGPTGFVRNAFRVWAPDVWSKIAGLAE